MKNIVRFSFVAMVAISFAACGGKGAKDKKGDVGDMKVKLEKLKKEKNALDAEIRKLEEDMAKADPKSSQQIQKLVTVDTLRMKDFSHYIELQGKIAVMRSGMWLQQEDRVLLEQFM